MKSHSSEKPYQCNECGISLKRKDGLKRHQSKHQEQQQELLSLGEDAEVSGRPVKCEI